MLTAAPEVGQGTDGINLWPFVKYLSPPLVDLPSVLGARAIPAESPDSLRWRIGSPLVAPQSRVVNRHTTGRRARASRTNAQV